MEGVLLPPERSTETNLIQIMGEGRVEGPGSRSHMVTVTPDLIAAAQYINLHRMPADQLNKVLAASEGLHGADLLAQHVDLNGTADFAHHGVAAQYYDTEELLSQDLTEEDRRLAVDLVASQLKHHHSQYQQQNQQNSYSLPTATSLSSVDLGRPSSAISTAAIVTSYIQAAVVSEDNMLQHHQQQSAHHMSSSDQDLHQVLVREQEGSSAAHHRMAVLKKSMLSSDQEIINLRNGNKFIHTPIMVQVTDVPRHAHMMSHLSTSSASSPPVESVKLEMMEDANECVAQTPAVLISPEDGDSDYDVNNEAAGPSRRSLPHKKRIPRKLKTPPARNIHSKYIKCSKCDEHFTTAVAFSMHKSSVHDATVSAKQRLPICASSSFSCELCNNKVFPTQLKFFEHLKMHYEPNESSLSNGREGNCDVTFNIENHPTSLNKINSPSELAPAPIIATCISPLSVAHQNRNVNNLASSDSTYSALTRDVVVVTRQHSSIIPNSPSVVSTNSQFSIKNELMEQEKAVIAWRLEQEVNAGMNKELKEADIKEEIVSSNRLPTCNTCGQIFKRQKSLEAHLATTHQEQIEEFSDPEDMMEGISIRHVVSMNGVMSGDEGEEQVSSSAPHQVMEKFNKWRYQEDASALVALNGIQCLPTNHTSSSTHLNRRDQNPSDFEFSRRMVHSHSSVSSQFESDPSIKNDDGSDEKPKTIMNVDDSNDPNSIDSNYSNVDDKINSLQVNSCAIKEESKSCEQVVDGMGLENHLDSNFNSNNKKHLKCNVCGRFFKSRNSFVYHERKHSGVRPHQCEVCGKSFYSASALKVHMRLHSGDKPYKCEFCGKNFRQWGDLKYHVTSLHSDEKQFQCEFCGKDFARKYSLIVHRRIHTGEKNYKCEFCPKSFRASSYLQNHRRIHTGEKPHKCDICGKPFRVRSDMKRHKQTHNKERPLSGSGTALTNNKNVQESSGNISENNDNSLDEMKPLLSDHSADQTPLNMNARQRPDEQPSPTTAVFVWIPAQSEDG